jgi:hypothetical protein
MEWVSYLLRAPRMPWLYTSAAVLAIAWAVLRIPALRQKIRALKQGRDGEKAVGQYLERLRARGAQVFHDVPGDGFNLDHVVIGDRGIFVAETKTPSKPSSDSRISFDDGSILIAGRRPDRDPVTQVLAQVSWLTRILEESTGRRFPIKGAVLFPGWFVEPPPKAAQLNVWLLEPKQLPGFIANEPVRLSEDEVRLAAFHLSRYIRTSK